MKPADIIKDHTYCRIKGGIERTVVRRTCTTVKYKSTTGWDGVYETRMSTFASWANVDLGTEVLTSDDIVEGGVYDIGRYGYTVTVTRRKDNTIWFGNGHTESVVHFLRRAKARVE